MYLAQINATQADELPRTHSFIDVVLLRRMGGSDDEGDHEGFRATNF
jgi:hypothetical protein